MACFVEEVSKGTRDIIGIDVHDSISIDTPGLIEGSKVASERLDLKERVFNNLTFPVVLIKKEGRNFFLYQTVYASKLKEL